MTSNTRTPADERRPAGPDERTIDWTVFGWSFAIITAFCIAGALFPDAIGAYANAALTWIVDNVGWLFVVAAAGFVGFSLYLAFSRYGRIQLSGQDERPEFSTVSWVAMMFSAGMGIGLIFYGVYEPLAHLSTPAPWLDVRPGSQEAGRLGLAYSFFHWGVHPWAIYAVVALALGYSTFRKGRGNLVSAPFQALLGKKRIVDDGWGKPIDIWAIVATKFGGATSLGLGALQIAAGLTLVFGVGGVAFGQQQTQGFPTTPLLVIAVLVAIAVLSAVSGVSRGIKWLSNTNLVLAALLVLFILVAGGAGFIFGIGATAGGAYVANLIPWSFRTTAFGGTDWMSSWTIFYWAWWISWTPFVSTFIARISRGRSIREFVIGVLLVPTAASAAWFTVLGGAGLNLTLNRRVPIVGADTDPAAAFFNLLQQYPGFTATSIVVIFLVAIFWVSGADASALVLGTLSSHGNIEPRRWLIALWAVASAAVAGVLLIVGGLEALQTFNIIVASPFVLIIIGLCWSLMADLRRDPQRQQIPGPVQRRTLRPNYATLDSHTEGANRGRDEMRLKVHRE